MISAFFILNLKGEVLISRVFRGDVKQVYFTGQAGLINDGCCYRRSVADIFRIHVVANPDVRSPIITLGSTSFFHVRHQNLYLAAGKYAVGMQGLRK